MCKKRKSIVGVLEDCGLQWTSQYFYWRGLGRKKEDLRPTVLIGTGEPQRELWWRDDEGVESVMSLVERKMGDPWVVEICYRVVQKY
jgi:hypothetical protein